MGHTASAINKGRIVRRAVIAIWGTALAVFCIVTACQNARWLRGDYREGDIIFQSLPRCELVDAIEGATQSEWSHCGVIMREGGKWVVYEALGNVHHTPLVEWIRRGRNNGRFEVYRLKPGITFDAEKLREQMQSLWGKPYDIHYEPDDNAIYCSELVYKAYARAAGIEIGAWQALGALAWEKFEPFILTIEPAVPLERLMITPVALTRSPLLQRIRPDRPPEAL
ncbi:MAG: hypothetical protein FWG50_06895 [Kiritimatiellaeota bacterium]|nr:hypothetical protein [Kiritimatiellota bacterium]